MPYRMPDLSCDLRTCGWLPTAEQLIEACKAGNVARVHELFDLGATVAARDARGWSPLVWAAFYGHDDVVAALLQHQADVDYRKSREDAEAEAIKRAQAEATANASGLRGVGLPTIDPATVVVPVNSPLHWAAFKVCSRADCFAGLGWVLRSLCHLTTRSHARLCQLPPQGRVQVVWQLLLHGFSAHEVDENGNNALHLAAAGGHPEVVRSIMCQGFEVDCPNGFGNDALCVSTNKEVTALLASAMDQAQCPICHKCTCCRCRHPVVALPLCCGCRCCYAVAVVVAMLSLSCRRTVAMLWLCLLLWYRCRYAVAMLWLCLLLWYRCRYAVAMLWLSVSCRCGCRVVVAVAVAVGAMLRRQGHVPDTDVCACWLSALPGRLRWRSKALPVCLHRRVLHRGLLGGPAHICVGHRRHPQAGTLLQPGVGDHPGGRGGAARCHAPTARS